MLIISSSNIGNRTRISTLKEWRPNHLDDTAINTITTFTSNNSKVIVSKVRIIPLGIKHTHQYPKKDSNLQPTV